MRNRLSLKNRLKKYLQKHGGWVSSGTLQKLALDNGYYSPQNTGRRLRELHEEGILQVEYRKGHAWYKAYSPAKKLVYRVPSLGKEIVAYE